MRKSQKTPHILRDSHHKPSGINTEISNADTQSAFELNQMRSTLFLKNSAIHYAIFLMCVFGSTTSFADCLTSKNQIDLNECIASEFARTEEALNVTYREYSLSLSVDQRRGFQESQHAWRKFMELSCDFESGMTGGSLRPTIQANCRTLVSRKRLKDFEFLRHRARDSHNGPPN